MNDENLRKVYEHLTAAFDLIEDENKVNRNGLISTYLPSLNKIRAVTAVIAEEQGLML